MEDTTVACIKFKSGAFGMLEGTTCVNPGMDHRLEVHGELGSILVSGEEILVKAIKEDREPMVSGEEARKAAEIILAVYESSKTGKQITLPLAYR